MKKNIILTVLSTLLLFALISIIGLYRDNTAKAEHIQNEEIHIEELKDALHLQENGSNTAEIAEKIAFINAGFGYYLNYNEDNYQARFEEMETYFSPDVIDKIQGAGGTEQPTVSIKSSTRNYVTYINPVEPNSFVYLTDLLYQVQDHEPVTFEMVYVIHVSETKQEYRIDRVDVVSGTPTNQ